MQTSYYECVRIFIQPRERRAEVRYMPLALITGVNTDTPAYRKSARIASKAERPAASNKRARLANSPRTVAGAPANEGKVFLTHTRAR